MTTQPTGKPRCAWADSSPLMRNYHDYEWGVPVRDSRALWEMLILEGFQAGLSWSVILRKREAFRAAFKGFEPEAVARFDEADIARLLDDPGIVRSRAKIEAAIAAAHIYLAIEKERPGAFARFVWQLAGGKPVRGKGTGVTQTPVSQWISAALKAKGFKFVGPVIVYAWMQAVGMVDDHAVGCFRRSRNTAAHKTRSRKTAIPESSAEAARP